MIRAADDYDAIRARLAEIGGERAIASDTIEVDVCYYVDNGYYRYKPLTDKGRVAFVNLMSTEDGYYPIGKTPPRFRGTENLIFEERPAP